MDLSTIKRPDRVPELDAYEMFVDVVDQNTLDWHNREWADPTYLFPKIEWKGVYKRVP